MYSDEDAEDAVNEDDDAESSVLSSKLIDIVMPSTEYEGVLMVYPDLDSQKECSICLDEFQSKTMVRLTLCFHIFHTE